MYMIPVNSRAISAIGYDAPTQQMQIRFTQGDTYTFCRVPASVFDSFSQASSKGTYYDRYIKGRYSC